MFANKCLLILGLAVGLSACARMEPASRSSGVEALTIASQGGGGNPVNPRTVSYAVQGVQVIVPDTLTVSEANSFKPRADIVWRGDAPGNRHTQIATILTEAATAANLPTTGGRAVTVELTLVKFHALTEKTRYTLGGQHELRFDLALRDAVTGALLQGPRRVVADVKAAGGAAAIAEDAAGRTQRVVITERLAQVLQRELSVPATATARDLVARAEAPPLLALR